MHRPSSVATIALVTQRQSFLVLIVYAVVVLAIITAAAVLCALSKLDAAAFTALVGTAVGVIGIHGAQFGTSALNGGPKADMTRVAEAQVAAGERPTTPGTNEQPGGSTTPTR